MRKQLEAKYFAFKRALKHVHRAFDTMTDEERAGMMLYVHGNQALEAWDCDFAHLAPDGSRVRELIFDALEENHK